MKKTIYTFRVYGAEGHRQRASFGPSMVLDMGGGVTITVKNAARLGALITMKFKEN